MMITITREETIFARYLNKKHSYNIKPNRRRASSAPFRITEFGEGVGFLKIQHQPFFKSKELFGIDPENAVIFKQEELDRYNAEGDDVVIFVRMKWEHQHRKISGVYIEVNAVELIRKINIQAVNYYINLNYDTTNKKSTAFYAVDLSEFLYI